MSSREQRYKDALWDYILEHSDIQKSGALFVKFHTSSRTQFEGHIRARMGGYHREDPKEKQSKAITVEIEHKVSKKIKNEKWKTDKATRFKIMQKVALENKVRNYPPPIRFIVLVYLKWKYL